MEPLSLAPAQQQGQTWLIVSYIRANVYGYGAIFDTPLPPRAAIVIFFTSLISPITCLAIASQPRRGPMVNTFVLCQRLARVQVGLQ